ncbi:uncharacterized protein BDR25DRAFT_354528 [Lindgomyces ingoldianus]|uniref:Uncharacterized protein n=1 Tax=Lindgomyces ingoldianus TaxID=673940 RepID=A0ACB6QWA3_9PLEO|nr:uncharacterized protein BDR25DRAFT_354528 [Lindgomyces ingoldianus]KAF2471283.1 hypothetical protein BDR25DRAFT_354528 [Lindgomyces ingoldianus]
MYWQRRQPDASAQHDLDVEDLILMHETDLNFSFANSETTHTCTKSGKLQAVMEDENHVNQYDDGTLF